MVTGRCSINIVVNFQQQSSFVFPYTVQKILDLLYGTPWRTPTASSSDGYPRWCEQSPFLVRYQKNAIPNDCCVQQTGVPIVILSMHVSRTDDVYVKIELKKKDIVKEKVLTVRRCSSFWERVKTCFTKNKNKKKETQHNIIH
jgi:hypothetical protein